MIGSGHLQKNIAGKDSTVRLRVRVSIIGLVLVLKHRTVKEEFLK